MIKNYNQRFYPNPFRQQGLKTNSNQYEIFETIRQKIKPFLTDKFSEIHDHMDEFGELKSEIRIFKILRERIKNKIALLTNSSNLFTKPLVRYVENINSFENYQKNLRYLDLPVQPLVDKKGFEIQSLTSELLEEAFDEIDDGFSNVYDYCANYFPDSIEMWNDYALFFEEKEFPFIAHDDILEASYEIFDKIFEDLQKNSVNLFNWVISGDLNSRLLKIIKPRIELAKINYLFIVLESLLSVITLFLIVKYIMLNYNSWFKINNKKLSPLYIKKQLRHFKKDLNFKKFRVEYKIKKMITSFNRLNLNNTLMYKTLRILRN